MDKTNTDPMTEALSEAARGRHLAAPNPMVGAVVVAGGRVVGRGHHRGPGTAHAEVMALAEAGELARGAELHVTLEPCNHHGSTPPCVDAVIGAGVSRVFIAQLPDPNPAVAGGGAARLRAAGIEVLAAGEFAAAALELNRGWNHLLATGRPWVLVKFAASLDGRVATAGGESRWITGAEARQLGHQLRWESDAVMIGSGTARSDDPELTARTPAPAHARQPLRVVLDTHLTLDPGSRLAGPNTLVICAPEASGDARRALEDRGCEVEPVAPSAAGLDLGEVLQHLGRRRCTSILVEGGPTLLGSLFDGGLADEVVAHLAPTIIGGAAALGAVGGAGAVSLELSTRLEAPLQVLSAGPDLVVRGRVLRGAGTSASALNLAMVSA